MTKTQLKQLIKECLNEIDFAPGVRPQSELTIVAAVIGSNVEDLKKYLFKLHSILSEEFGNNITFDEKLNTTIFPNKDKKAEVTFTIKNQYNLKVTKETLIQIHEELTMWSIRENLVIDFTFKIKN